MEIKFLSNINLQKGNPLISNSHVAYYQHKSVISKNLLKKDTSECNNIKNNFTVSRQTFEYTSVNLKNEDPGKNYRELGEDFLGDTSFAAAKDYKYGANKVRKNKIKKRERHFWSSTGTSSGSDGNIASLAIHNKGLPSIASVVKKNVDTFQAKNEIDGSELISNLSDAKNAEITELPPIHALNLPKLKFSGKDQTFSYNPTKGYHKIILFPAFPYGEAIKKIKKYSSTMTTAIQTPTFDNTVNALEKKLKCSKCNAKMDDTFINSDLNKNGCMYCGCAYEMIIQRRYNNQDTIKRNKSQLKVYAQNDVDVSGYSDNTYSTDEYKPQSISEPFSSTWKHEPGGFYMSQKTSEISSMNLGTLCAPSKPLEFNEIQPHKLVGDVDKSTNLSNLRGYENKKPSLMLSQSQWLTMNENWLSANHTDKNAALKRRMNSRNLDHNEKVLDKDDSSIMKNRGSSKGLVSNYKLSEKYSSYHDTLSNPAYSNNRETWPNSMELKESSGTPENPLQYSLNNEAHSRKTYDTEYSQKYLPNELNSNTKTANTEYSFKVSNFVERFSKTYNSLSNCKNQEPKGSDLASQKGNSEKRFDLLLNGSSKEKSYEQAGSHHDNLNFKRSPKIQCYNCKTEETPLWRRNSLGNKICNACGLYFKLHKQSRPVNMKQSAIRRRTRIPKTLDASVLLVNSHQYLAATNAHLISLSPGKSGTIFENENITCNKL